MTKRVMKGGQSFSYFWKLKLESSKRQSQHFEESFSNLQSFLSVSRRLFSRSHFLMIVPTCSLEQLRASSGCLRGCDSFSIFFSGTRACFGSGRGAGRWARQARWAWIWSAICSSKESGMLKNFLQLMFFFCAFRSKMCKPSMCSNFSVGELRIENILFLDKSKLAGGPGNDIQSELSTAAPLAPGSIRKEVINLIVNSLQFHLHMYPYLITERETYQSALLFTAYLRKSFPFSWHFCSLRLLLARVGTQYAFAGIAEPIGSLSVFTSQFGAERF